MKFEQSVRLVVKFILSQYKKLKNMLELLKKIMSSEVVKPNNDTLENSNVILQVLSIFNSDVLETLSNEVETFDEGILYKTILQKVLEIQKTENDVTKILSVNDIEIRDRMVKVLNDKEFIDKISMTISNNNVFVNYINERNQILQNLNTITEEKNITNFDGVINNINNLSNYDIMSINEFITNTQNLSPNEISDVINNIINSYENKISVNNLQNEFNTLLDIKNSETINIDVLDNILNEDIINKQTILNQIINNTDLGGVIEQVNNTTQNVLNVINETTQIENIENVNRVGVNNQNLNIQNLVSEIGGNNIQNLVSGDNVQNLLQVSNVEFGGNILNNLSTEVVNEETKFENIINNNIENVYNSIDEIRNEFMTIVNEQLSKPEVSSPNVDISSTTSNFKTPTNNMSNNVSGVPNVIDVYPKVKDVRDLPKFKEIGEY